MQAFNAITGRDLTEAEGVAAAPGAEGRTPVPEPRQVLRGQCAGWRGVLLTEG